MVDTTLTEDMLSGGNAITDPTKVGTSIELVTDIQDTHLPMELNSKSSQECHPTEHCSGTSILVQANSDSESETTTQRTTDNGGPSMTEPRQSEPGLEETMSLPTDKDIDSESTSQLLPDHTETRTTRESDGMEEDTETSETTHTSVLRFKAEETFRTNQLSSTTATTVLVKHGTSINKVSHIQDNHFQMAEDSKSDQECQPTELSSGENILDHTNINSESEITGQEKESNGSSSTEELEPSELLRRDPTLLQTDKDMVIELVNLQSSDHTEVRSTRELPSMVEDTETSETMPKNVSTFMEEETETKCMLSSGTATMDKTNNGTLIPLESDIQDNHTQTTEDSKSDQECQEEEHCVSLSTLEETNTDLESETATLGTSTNGSTSTEDQEPSDLLLTEEEQSHLSLDTDTDNLQLLLEFTKIMLTKRLPSMVVLTETSETTVESALMLLEIPTLTTDTLNSTDATTEETKDGG